MVPATSPNESFTSQETKTASSFQLLRDILLIVSSQFLAFISNVSERDEKKILAKGGALKHEQITVAELHRLIDQEAWFNDEIMNSWSALAFSLWGHEDSLQFIVSSFFWTRVMQRKYERAFRMCRVSFSPYVQGPIGLT